MAIDSGNSSTKIGLITNGKLGKIIEKRSYRSIIKTIYKLNPDQIILGTVNIPARNFENDLADFPIYIVTHRTPLPFELKYGTPHTLGIDRLASTAGAWEKFPGKNILIIDLGTCITYDFINKEGHYLGGGISPGLDMRFKSLHHYTANLPLVKFKEDAALIGNSTTNSILSGVINGTIAELEGIINKFHNEHHDIKVILCGGHVKFFESKLKDRIFVIPELVLSGLFSIYRYNV